MKKFFILTTLSLFVATGCDVVQSLPIDSSSTAAVDNTVPISQIMSRLQKSEKELNKLYENLNESNGEKSLAKAAKSLEQIQKNYNLLGDREDLTTENEQEAQMISLRSHYLASQMLPGLQQTVVNQAAQIMQMRPATGDAAIAKVLDFCCGLDLKKKVDLETMKSLVETAKTFPNQAHGVALYSAVAQEYWKNCQCKSAEKVLEFGIKQFKDSPQKTTLVHQMVDQGHRDPPNKGRLCQKAFQRSQRAIEGSLAASSNVMKFRS